jgi:streptogramin lyase
VRVRVAISTGLALLAVAVTPGLAAANSPTVTEYNTGVSLNIGAWDIASVDNEVWFTQDVFGTVGRADLAGLVTDVTSGLLTRGGSRGMVVGPDGNVWVAESGGTGAIARVEADGTVTEFDTGLTAGDPWDIAVGKDNNLWFVNRDPAIIGRINPADGTITEYSTGLTANSLPSAITTGPDGDVWFVERATGKIGVLCVDDGTITEFDTGLTGADAITDITAGPDGKLWFTINGDPGGIGKMDTSGNVKAIYRNGITQNMRPMGIAEGSDGALWFTESAGAGAIGRITTAGIVTEYTDGLTPGMAPWFIAQGPDGNMWFTENALLGQVARISLPPVVRGLAPNMITKTSATLRAKLQANSQDTDYYFEYGLDSYYGDVTSMGPLSGGASLELVEKDIEDLAAGTEYHFRLVATNGSGTSYGPDRTFRTLPEPSVGPSNNPPASETPREPEQKPDEREPEPDFGKSIVAEPDGNVKVKMPGGGWHTMEPGAEMPMGATFDTRRGAVNVTSAGCKGGQQTGRFGGGLFTLRQPRAACGRVDIYLRGGSFRSCRNVGHRAKGRGSVATASRSRRVRRLWGRDKGGKFRTHGRNSQATVRGTRWVTVDRCDGTFTRVTEGAVSVRDKVRHRTVLVRAGHSYLAKSRAQLRREHRRARRHRH